MKKVFITIIVLFMSLISFGQQIQVCDKNFPSKNISPYSDLITVTDANTSIRTYTSNPLSVLDNGSTSFFFDAGTLFDFIYGKTPNIQDVQFLLGYDGNKHLQLYIAALNITSDYLTKANTIADDTHDPDIRMNTLYCSGNCILSVGNGTLEDVSSADPANAITVATLNATAHCPGIYLYNSRQSEASCANSVPKRTANRSIRNYDDWMPTSEQTNSFIFDAGTIESFLQYATGYGIQDLQFFLGRDSKTKQLQLIIGAIDQQGNHIYKPNNSGNACVFEHCFPCPADCPGLSGRTTITNR